MTKKVKAQAQSKPKLPETVAVELSWEPSIDPAAASQKVEIVVNKGGVGKTVHHSVHSASVNHVRVQLAKGAMHTLYVRTVSAEGAESTASLPFVPGEVAPATLLSAATADPNDTAGEQEDVPAMPGEPRDAPKPGGDAQQLLPPAHAADEEIDPDDI